MRIAFSIVIAALLIAPSRFGAAATVPELRAATALSGYPGVYVLEASWGRGVPGWTHASRLDVTFGAIGDSRKSRPFATIAPVWTLGRPDRSFFAEFSFGPVFLGGSEIAGRELGGNFHFRSGLSLGVTLGRERNTRFALRISHISNGGIRAANPGFDYAGLSFAAGGGGAENR